MTPRVVPPGLRPGDRVVVVSPAGPVVPERLDRGLALLRSWGYDAVAAPHAHDTAPAAPYLAGADEDRAGDLMTAWCDPRTRAVVCSRGGFGSARLLPHLDWAALAAAGPRLLVGSSDVTTLHTAVGRRLGLVTLFGPMAAAAILASDEADAGSVAGLRAALADPTASLPLHGAEPVVGGTARGRLAGGTLALLCAALATPDPPDLSGTVLFLEDVGEAPYRLDRAWTQLEQAGVLADVVGVALGSFEDCGRTGAATVARLAAGLGVPVVAGLEVGHGPVQRSLPLGVEVVLDADAGALSLAG